MPNQIFSDHKANRASTLDKKKRNEKKKTCTIFAETIHVLSISNGNHSRANEIDFEFIDVCCWIFGNV